jgi:lipopolysaccharide export system protein LptA
MSEAFIMRPGNLLYFLILLLFNPVAMAKTSDTNEPVSISADSVEIREKEGTSIYRGNVKISKGSMQIQGELIHIYSDDNGLSKIYVEGKPARFRQLNDQDEEVSSQSEQMEYTADNGILTLIKDAVLIQNKNNFSSQHIVYDTKNDIVQAGKTENDNNNTNTEPGRVTITIQPKVKDTNQQ